MACLGLLAVASAYVMDSYCADAPVARSHVDACYYAFVMNRIKILIMNGPNLNLLGRRELGIYGNAGMDECLENLKVRYPMVDIEYFQSNSEGALIDELHRVGFDAAYAGVVLNAGAYTHTSLAIADAIAAIAVPVVEVHISNIQSREPIRHTSLIAPVCRGSIAGFGLESYRLGIESLL